jgi:cell division protein FtsW
MLAIAGGGETGTGLGSGESKWQWLPNAHTDFAFSVVAEELGIAGAALILGLFVLLIYALVRIARDTGSLFVRLFTGAVAFLFAGQALINLGAVTGLLPITGVPLPLISFGGTALIVKVGVLGMVAAMARSEPVVAQALALRRARRGPGLFTRLRLSLRRGRGDEE